MKPKTQHRKKDDSSSYAKNHLDTQSITGEENNHRNMPVNVDNHCAGKIDGRKLGFAIVHFFLFVFFLPGVFFIDLELDLSRIGDFMDLIFLFLFIGFFGWRFVVNLEESLK